jgi:pimeloyl-ACP methyl ester carboxylesterase
MRLGGIALLAAVVVACGGGSDGGGGDATGGAGTDSAPSARSSSSSGPAYTVESFIQPYEATSGFLTDPEAGVFNLEAGFVGFVTRTVERYPQVYDPNRLLDPSGGFANLERELQVVVDSALHAMALPKVPYNILGNTPFPAFMPDWDHDGVFGNPGDWDVDIDGDTHGNDLAAQDTGYFFYPCPQLDGSVLYETANGDCVALGTESAAFKFGVARELKVVDSRGLVLDATLWVPGEAFSAAAFGAGGDCPVFSDPDFAARERWQDCVEAASFAAETLGTFPGLVFSDGFLSRQEQYYWVGMRMARAGYVVLTHDPAGQGESEGTIADLFAGGGVSNCQFTGSCRDTQDVVRWFVGDDISPDGNAIPPRVAPLRHPAYLPEGENFPNPALSLLDRDRVALAGHSMGGLSTLSYLNHLGSESGHGADGRPLPRVAAAVAFSAAAETRAVVPIQFQTADGDGSPTLFLLPGIFGITISGEDDAIGPQLTKERYDRLRRQDPPSGDGALSLIVLEGGSHADWAAYPVMPRSLSAITVAGDYAANWLDCHVKGDGGACDRASTRPGGLGPTDDPGADHLSRAFASEHDPDGPSGGDGSRCIKVPDQAHLNLDPAAFLAALGGAPPFDCEL